MTRSKLHPKFPFASIVSFLLSLFSTTSLASVPRNSEIMNDTAIYQNLREIKAERIRRVDFSGDLKRLAQNEQAYHESFSKSARPLAQPRITSPMARIESTPYKFSGKRLRAAQD